MSYSLRMHPATLKTLAAACKLVVEEATFTVSPDGLLFRAMDPSHVEMVDVFIPPAGFQAFECAAPAKFALRTEDLVKLAGRLDSGDEAVVLAEADANAVSLIFAGKFRREFTLHTLDDTVNVAALPEVKYTVKATLTLATLERVLGDVAVVADQVGIDADAEELGFSGRSDVGSAAVRIAGAEASLECADPAKAAYALGYLTAFLKGVGGACGADAVKMEMAAKKPVRLTFTLGESGGAAALLLAPRVSAD